MKKSKLKFFKEIIIKNSSLLAKDWIKKYLNIQFEDILLFLNIRGINAIMLISNIHHRKNQFHLVNANILEVINNIRNSKFIQFKFKE